METRTEPRPGSEPTPIDAVIEILRAQEGRTVHVRQIVEMALKRKLLRGDSAEMIRLLRAAILADGREREAVGLRPRVRPTGGLSYMLDRRLENELYQLERELSDRVTRLGELSRTVLFRRLSHLPAPAFEALMRVVIGRLGISPVELVKRGEGVAYLGGERKVPGGRRKVLVAVRPGDAEVTRRSVGELRAGLKARGYDEGILLTPGRAGAEALAEMTENGGSIILHDGEELAMLCARLGVGTMRRTFSIDVLDVDLLAEVQEA